MNDKTKQSTTPERADDQRAQYESPRMTKKRSVARVTLFSGSGASGASGLTSA